MTLIGLSQRLDLIEPYKEVRESLDQRWGQCLVEQGYSALPLSNTIPFLDIVEKIPFDGFLLTGGKNLHDPYQSSRDCFEHDLLTYAFHHRIPILGVCRGFQVMNYFLKGSLQPCKGHVAKSHDVLLFDHMTIHVNSFHSLTVKTLGDDMEPFAQCCHDQSIEGAFHKTLPWIGIMWHIERDEIFHDFSRQILHHVFIKKSLREFKDACHRFQ